MDKVIQLQKDGKDLHPINSKVIRSGDKATFKYADGTMKNTIKVSVNFGDYVTDDTTILSFNFLTEFVDIPDSISHSIVINPTHRTLVSLSTNLSLVNNKGGNLLVTHNGLYENRNSFIANITAIGRWK